MTKPTPGVQPEQRYAGFISYSHGGDAAFAEALQREVERFAKPWNRTRAVRLFRDATNLTASPGLWAAIEAALSTSTWLVLLASPTAAGSEWVGKEIHWWAAHRDAGRRILLVLTDGELVWDDSIGDFDPVASTALHPALRGVFTAEPLWVDARWARETSSFDIGDPQMQRTVVDIASTLRGLEKDMLVGEAVREQRRTKRLARAAVTSLATLTVVAVAAGIFAWFQRGSALDALRVSESRQLAALAQQHRERDLGVAATLALGGIQLDENEQTQTALTSAALDDPLLSRILSLPAPVSAVARGTSDAIVVVGTEGGDVTRWDAGTDEAQAITTLSDEIRALAASADGETVLASTADAVTVILGTSAAEIALPPLMSTGTWSIQVGVSPDGSRGWVGATGAPEGADWRDRTAMLCEVDFVAQTCTELLDVSLQAFRIGALQPLVSTDGIVTLFDPVHGSWARIDPTSKRQLSSGTYGFGTYQSVPATSPDGSWLGVGSHDSASSVLLWPNTASGQQDETRIATGVSPRTQSIAISPTGEDIAVSYLGGVSLVRGVLADPEAGTTIGLSGAEDTHSLTFLRDGQGLLGVRDSRVLFWDLTQTSRVPSARFDIPLPGGCAGCAAPTMYISPDESRILAREGSGRAMSLVDVRSGDITPAADASYDLLYARPTWTIDGTPILPVVATAGGSAPGFVPTHPGDMVSWAQPTGDQNSLAIVTREGDRVVTFHADGTLREHDGRSGEVLDVRSITASEDIVFSRAAFSPTGTVLVAVENSRADSDATRVIAVRLDQGELSAELVAAGEYQEIAWQADGLLLQDATGRVEVRTDSDWSLQTSFTANGARLAAADASGQSHLAALIRADNSIDLVDTQAGHLVTTFASRSGALYDRSSVAFTPLTGRFAVLHEPTGSPSFANLTIYDLATEQLTDAACRIAWTALVPDRWAEFAPGIAAPSELCSRP